jgi:hypothetical protein
MRVHPEQGDTADPCDACDACGANESDTPAFYWTHPALGTGYVVACEEHASDVATETVEDLVAMHQDLAENRRKAVLKGEW